MRSAKVLVLGVYAGLLQELSQTHYRFEYDDNYCGPAVSLTMPIQQKIYEYNTFPPFFDGLLPEGAQLEALLRQSKIDRSDYFSQLIQVGQDVVGGVSVMGE